MSDFTTWLKRRATAVNTGNAPPVGQVEYHDLAQLTAQQQEALEAAVAQACDDEDVERSPCACDWCGAWAEVTNTLYAAEAFKEKYG